MVESVNSDTIMESVGSTDKEQVLLTESYHVATLDNDAPTIFAKSLEFIKARSWSI